MVDRPGEARCGEDRGRRHSVRTLVSAAALSQSRSCAAYESRQRLINAGVERAFTKSFSFIGVVMSAVKNCVLGMAEQRF